MGRTTQSVGAPPASQRRDIRAKKAKQTANKDIPALLQAYPRARKGIEAAELIVDPPSVPLQLSSQDLDAARQKKSKKEGVSKDDNAQQNDQITPTLTIRIAYIDTLQAAAQLFSESKDRKSKTSNKIAVLNMASPLRPGGGFFTGATSQEESLCMRTTLYPSLREEFYRLPEIGGIYTHEVLVFRSYDSEATDLPKTERFFVDVITSGMLRFPEVEEGSDGEKRYVDQKDRDLVERKMRAVLRMAVAKGVKRLVLGAWGCGAYGNPVVEVARLWRKVLSGSATPAGQKSSRKKGSISVIEDWSGLEILFAIKDGKMAEAFATELGLQIEGDMVDGEEDIDGSDADCAESMDERTKKISQLEEQISEAKSEFLKQGLQNVLNSLKEQ